MRVDQLHKQLFFDGISSRLRMYKTSAFGMPNEVFLCQIQQLKKMTMTSSAIKHYQFSSCLRLYLLGKTPIWYPKTAQKATLKTCAVHKRRLNRIRFTPDSIAAYDRKKSVEGPSKITTLSKEVQP